MMDSNRQEFERYIKSRNGLPSEYDDLAGCYKDLAIQTLYRAWLDGKRYGNQQATDKLTELHGKTLGKHNYYAHAVQEVKRLRK